MERKGFTLLELLVVMSVILVLLSISLPCLLRAKDSALALVAREVAVNKEGKVFLEINDRPNRRATDDIYGIRGTPYLFSLRQEPDSALLFREGVRGVPTPTPLT